MSPRIHYESEYCTHRFVYQFIDTQLDAGCMKTSEKHTSGHISQKTFMWESLSVVAVLQTEASTDTRNVYSYYSQMDL